MPACEDDYLLLSGIQHYAFCPRQWALIHVEQQWAENERTVEGEIVHSRCHDDGIREKRGATIVVRGLRVVSHKLRLVGTCDVVEFNKSPDGVPIHGAEGLWLPVPVEYKRGKTKAADEDRVQVCAQAIALEEMFCCSIPWGFLYYNETRQREKVTCGDELREKVFSYAASMDDIFERGHTPRPKRSGRCRRCSLVDLCEPGLDSVPDVECYIHSRIDELVDI